VPPQELTDRLPSSFGTAYVLERELGRGGMATVYLAEDRRHRRRVAVKVLNPELAATLGAERFLREIEIAARLSHPHILPLHDSGSEDGRLYYVMPYVAGETLRARLQRDGPLPVAEAARIAAEVAEALDYAHRQGVVHRDVKPENILLTEGHAVVADFGIAHAVHEAASGRLTASGVTLGTPAYMSPEQALGGKDLDGRSDLFSLGSVLYEMLAGEAPFAGPTLGATVGRVITGPMPPLRERRPEVPPALEATLQRALAKEPEARFATGRELAAALRAATSAVTPGGAAWGRARWWRRRRAGALVAGALVTAAAAAMALRSRGGPDAEPLPSVAVLPFATERADTATAYLGTGMAEELLSALADVPGVRVASRTSSFAASAAGGDLRNVARRLGVAAVLEGSVQRDGGTLRVTARLVDARKDALIWSDHFDRPAAAIFDVQEEIARGIVDRLRVRLGSGAPVIVRRRTASLRAHDLVLRAREAARGSERAGLIRAAALLSEAQALDSTYAETYAQMAGVYSALAVWRDQTRLPGEQGLSAGEMLRRARVAAQRAVTLDDQSASAHGQLGGLLFRYDWDWRGAEREFLRAIELNPTAADAHGGYSRFLRSMGRFEESRREQRLAHTLSPDVARRRGLVVGRISFFEHDFERAIRETLAEPNTDARSWRTWLGQAYIGAGRFAAAESLLADTARSTDEGQPVTLALLYARTGRHERARTIIRAIRGTEADLPTHVAAVFLALGDTTAAVRELERAIDTRDPLVVDLKVDPWISTLRHDPRFRHIYDRLAFPP
jgi:TolB-like protein/tRNA A-37 threonylcarbamoyl transferase component Bud32